MQLTIGLALVVVFSMTQCDTKGASAATETEDNGGYDNLPFYFDYVQQMVDERAENQTLLKVLEDIYTLTSGEKSVYAYVAFHNNLKKKNKLNAPEILDMAFDLRTAMDDVNRTDPAYKSGTQLKSKLPKSVRSLVFAKCLLLRRDSRREDMYAAEDKYNKDDKRRRIFTWIPGNPQNNKQGCWSVTPDYDSPTSAFFIQNANSHEFVYADVDDKIDDQRRTVFSLISGEPNNQSQWIFELRKDDVYIKNKFFGEYLTADNSNKYDNKRRMVFTSKKKSRYALWRVVDGDQEKLNG